MSLNFALILFILVVMTGLAWLSDKLYFAKQRRKQADAAIAHLTSQATDLLVDQKNQKTAPSPDEILRQPWWLEYTAGLFPVILLVFLLRSFIVEPFKIPSGSMIPTLLVGDFILVNKFTYGIRLPVIDKKIIDINRPKRGDVMVFRYPKDPSLDYIKRVVGLPGDTVVYQNKRLTINGQPLVYQQFPDYLHEDALAYSQQFSEKLGTKTHQILNDPGHDMTVTSTESFPYQNHCQYTTGGISCTIPSGHYFVMGDNRDNSADSRVWGFVPEENIVGQAFFIWMNLRDLSRIGTFQ